MNKQILILTYDELRAKKIAEDIKAFDRENIELFPPREVVFYDIEAYSHEISHQRLKVLSRLSNKEDIIVVVSIRAVLNKVMEANIFRKHNFTLEYGKQIDLNFLTEKFVVQGYERVNMVEGKGQFSIRGGIIDFFPITSDRPFRVELFDDEIDSIRTFDIKSQRSVTNMTKAEVLPAKEIFIEEQYKEEIIKSLESDLKLSAKRLKKKSTEEIVEKLNEKFSNYIEKIQNNLSIENVDLIIPYIPKGFSSIASYFRRDSIIVIDEPQRIEESVKSIREDFIIKYTDLFERGEDYLKI